MRSTYPLDTPSRIFVAVFLPIDSNSDCLFLLTRSLPANVVMRVTSRTIHIAAWGIKGVTLNKNSIQRPTYHVPKVIRYSKYSLCYITSKKIIWQVDAFRVSIRHVFQYQNTNSKLNETWKNKNHNVMWTKSRTIIKLTYNNKSN